MREQDTSDADFTLVGAVIPGEDLYQRRLARAILAQQSAHLPGVDRNVYPAERLRRAKRLGEVSDG